MEKRIISNPTPGERRDSGNAKPQPATTSIKTTPPKPSKKD